MKLNWKPPKLPTKTTAVYTWDPVSEDGFHYAAVVHNGARLRNGGEIQSRPFTRYALSQVDLVDTFADSYQRSESLERAFQDTAQTYNRENQKAISSRVWSWPNTTRRRSGEVAGTRRDIVDLGGLLDSQKLEFKR